MNLLRLLRPRRPARPATPPSAEADTLAALIGPASVEVTPRYLKIGEGYASTLIVNGYPAEAGAGWLLPLTGWPGRADVVIHIEPLAPQVAASRLRRQRARLESSRRADAQHGRLEDPGTEAAAADAAELADRVARGASRLFRVGHYVTVHAPNLDELTESVAHVRATAASVMLDTVPATWRQLPAWTSTLPMGVDSIGMRRVFDTDALAAAMPLASADLPAPLPGDPPSASGVLYGVNTATNGIIWHDRWAADNHNSLVLARSGAGKSYFIKLETLRSLYDGVQVNVIDPEDEYLRLAEAVGGTVIQLGAPNVRLNPLDIAADDNRPDARNRRALFMHTLINVLLGAGGHDGAMAPTERAALDRAVNTAYLAAGITNEPTTWARPAPLLRDVAAALEVDATPPALTLAARLSPWTTGSFSHLFDGPTTTDPTGHLVVWSTRQLADELRAPGMLLALDAIWRTVDAPPADGPTADPRRLVIVDEAWTLLRDGEGVRFLNRLAKAARKRRAGVSVVTQDAADLLGSELGQAVVANAATQLLMRQAPQAIAAVADSFNLTGGEARMLLSAQRGESLLLAGANRVGAHAVSSQREHELCVTGDLDGQTP
ncbi:VirB4 family type IV secretion system protein [Micromonospora lupini]|uniref:Type IV secretory pathway VirB4 protein-like protein n=1 Tax=Micromonospora lupini str. Lupac 08 TaxID=1150864 RepID=I0L1M3_9ACTN|nr:Type IV secretory pathway VirB4 protein-like protein [Micromonospora lupini str. Lupac 08]